MSEYKSIFQYDSAPLATGAEIIFGDNTPPYRVCHNDLQGKLLILERIRSTQATSANKFPALIEITTSPYTIGRKNDSDFVLYDNHISRAQGKIHFDSQQGMWCYQHLGINSVKVKEAEVQKPPPPSVQDTIFASIPLPPPTTISDGMFIQFHPSMPLYKAEAHNLHSQPKLILHCYSAKRHGDTVMPYSITITPEAPVTLGKQIGDEVNLAIPHNDMSEEHATIFWDQSQQAFIYQPRNHIAPVIRTPSLLEALHTQYKTLTFTPEAAEMQLAEITQIQNAITEMRQNLSRMQFLEGNSVSIEAHEINEGAITEEVQKGYALWLRIFEILYRETLTEQESSQLCEIADIINNIGDFSKAFKELDRLPTPVTGKPFIFFDINDKIDGQAKIQCDMLESKGEIYLPSGCKGHHTVTRIRKGENNGYIVTIYNAGYGASHASDDKELVYGMEEKRLKTECTPLKFIRTVITAKISPTSLYKPENVENCLEPKRLRQHIVSRQHRGNCTTRSTREMIRDLIPTNLFSQMQIYLSDPSTAPTIDLEVALEMKQGKLEALFPAQQVLAGSKADRGLPPNDLATFPMD